MKKIILTTPLVLLLSMFSFSAKLEAAGHNDAWAEGDIICVLAYDGIARVWLFSGEVGAEEIRLSNGLVDVDPVWVLLAQADTDGAEHFVCLHRHAEIGG